MIIQLNERALFALGFDAAGVEAMRHFLRMVGTLKDSQTLPETAMKTTMGPSSSTDAQVAEVRKQLHSSRVQIPNAAVAEMQKQIDALNAQVQLLARANADMAELRKYAEGRAVRAMFPAQATDWEHPGKIGDKTPNTGAFTYLNIDPADIPLGTALLPSMYLGIDKTTGWYRTAPNEWAFSISTAQQIKYTIAENLFKQNVKTEKQLVSTIVTGTPPLVVTSTTLVPNLHVSTADSLGTASTYPANATDLATVITLANAIKANNIAKGV